MVRDLEKMVIEIPVKHIVNLTKNVKKYEEQVNKCDISETNLLAKNIGADIEFLKYTEIRTSEEQKQEFKHLEEIFLRQINSLKRCRCVRKLEK